MENNNLQKMEDFKKYLTPNDLIKKHILDPNHKVTEEEFRLLKVGKEAEDVLDVRSSKLRRRVA